MKNQFIFIFILAVCSSINAQLPINFKNPSFEGAPKTSVVDSIQLSMNWINCIDPEKMYASPYDIQPGSFKVVLAPYDGNSFIGLVTRADGSYEGICQELDEPLEKDSTYQFSIYLAKSLVYESPPNVFDRPTVVTHSKKKQKTKKKKKNIQEQPWPAYLSYTNSTIFSVWGGLEMCATDELLFESTEVDHEGWREYIVEFTPSISDMNFISLEAYFPNDSIYTRGNLMIDFINFEFSK